MAPVPTAEACHACGAALRSALVCEHCGRLQAPPRPPTPFEALGFEPGFALDSGALRRRLLELSRALHPDVHARADAATQRLAQDNTAALNAAHAQLASEERRADWLVRSLGGPKEDEERTMPALFLAEVLEWNETIEAARETAPGSPARRSLDELSASLEAERERRRRAIAAALTPLPPAGSPALRRTRQELNALRYLARALGELAELRLSAPA
jgi:molecular chaperone HscB